MKTLVTIILFSTALHVYSQDKDSVVIENGMCYEKSKVSNFFDSLLTSNDYILYFKIVSNWMGANEKIPAYILTKNQKEYSAWKCTYQFTSSLSTQYTKLDLPQDSLALVWRSYVDNQLFRMKSQQELPRNCQYAVFDMGTYHFMLISKDKMKILDFDAPEEYLKHCNDMQERKQVVQCAAVIRRILE